MQMNDNINPNYATLVWK